MTSSFSNNNLPSFPTDGCSDSPTTAHYFCHIQLGVFRCKYCGASKWQPQDFPTAIDFSREAGKLGIQRAYSKRLSGHKATVALIVALQTDFVVRQNVNKEVADVVAKVIMPTVRRRAKSKVTAKERLGVRRSIYNE